MTEYQPQLFDDPSAAIAARDAGIAQVSEGKGAWLETVRRWAAAYAEQWGGVTSDDVRRSFTLPPGAHQNTWGAVFRDSRFTVIGRRPSSREDSHAREIKVWGSTG